MAAGYRVLVTTLTKKMAEDLTDYLAEQGVRVQYLHSDVDTMARVELLRELRLGHFDVLVGINLLREGLDLPEVALVAILDADKEGFLRSASSLIQTMGRAARNVHGRVVMYADTLTDSMKNAIGETERRRARQVAYNEAHGIDPQSITKAVTDILERVRGESFTDGGALPGGRPGQQGTGPSRQTGEGRSPGRCRSAGVGRRNGRCLGPDADELSRLIHRLEAEMMTAAEELRFEEAALIRDEAAELRALLARDPVDGSPVLTGDTADIEVPSADDGRAPTDRERLVRHRYPHRHG